MKSPLALICAGVLALGACDKTPTSPPTPVVTTPVPTESAATAGPATDPSVPSAESVFPNANTPIATANPGRSMAPLSDAQESTAMPMPGQNNDHSAPAAPASRASSPS